MLLSLFIIVKNEKVSNAELCYLKASFAFDLKCLGAELRSALCPPRPISYVLEEAEHRS